MNGFQADIQKKIIGAQSHLNAYGPVTAKGFDELSSVLKKDPAVAATAPFILGQAILTRGERTSGIVLKGLDAGLEFQVNDLGQSLYQGDWKDLGAGKNPGIVLGEELAAAVGARPGDEVVLVSPKSVATPLGLLPKMQRFRVTGLLRTGYYEYDSTMGYADISVVGKFLGVEAGATGVAARLKDLRLARPAAARIAAQLGPGVTIRTFDQLNRTLFAALKLEKFVMFLILTLITIVASLNIASTLILRSVEKTRDIGLLKSMGASPGQIRRIFWTEGFLIGLTGVVMGTGLGLALCWIIHRYPVVELPADIYYLSRVPVHVETSDVLAVVLIGLLLSLLATVYPALRASKVDPVEAIHYG
jgi:lipoprotein-releasing system permease protein